MKKPKFSKFKDKLDKFSSDFKEKTSEFSSDIKSSSLRAKYKAKSLLEKSKAFLKGYESLDDSYLLQEDVDDIQSGLSKMLSDAREENKEVEQPEIVWESITTYKNIQEKKIEGTKKYWIFEFCTLFENIVEQYDLNLVLNQKEKPRDKKSLVFLRLYRRLKYISRMS